MTNWYLLPGNSALGFVLIILRSSIMVKITAGKMIELSLSTFGNVSIRKYVSLDLDKYSCYTNNILSNIDI